MLFSRKIREWKKKKKFIHFLLNYLFFMRLFFFFLFPVSYEDQIRKHSSFSLRDTNVIIELVIRARRCYANRNIPPNRFGQCEFFFFTIFSSPLVLPKIRPCLPAADGTTRRRGFSENHTESLSRVASAGGVSRNRYFYFPKILFGFQVFKV